MELVKCALCLYNCSPGIKLAKNLLNSDGIETLSQGDKDIPVRDQLQIVFLLRKILEVPQEKCCDFLRDYGDPCSWINCCDSCSTLVGKGRIIFDQIMKLQKQFEHLQTEIKNIIIRSANSEEFNWGRGVQGEMRSFITKEFYQANPIKEEFVADLPCHDITINNETVAESILGCFPEDIEDLELQQNSLIGVKNGCSTYQMNSLLSNNCDSEEQDPLRELDRDAANSNLDNKQDIQKFISVEEHCEPETILSSNPEDFSVHMQTNAEDSLQIKHRCEFCSKHFPNAGSLVSHQRIHKEKKPYKCKCGKRFEKDNIMKAHERKCSGKCCMCEICGKGFATSESLRCHKRMHTGKKRFKCGFCEKSFRRSNNLNDHERTHTGHKPFQCQLCEKSFSQSHSLKAHERKHTGEKPYKCQFCEKSYPRSDHLKTHERSHIGEKSFRCEHCEKSFSQSNDLKRHKRSHTGENPYKCQFCEKSFAFSYTLKGHEMISHRKPFKCQFCAKSFHRSDQLKEHEIIHTGDHRI